MTQRRTTLSLAVNPQRETDGSCCDTPNHRLKDFSEP